MAARSAPPSRITTSLSHFLARSVAVQRTSLFAEVHLAASSSSSGTVLALLGVVSAFSGYGRSVLPLTLHEIGRDLEIDATTLSFAFSTIAAGALGVLAIGALADRFGRRRLLLGAVVCSSLAGAATSGAGGLVVLIVCQVFARAFQESALAIAAVLATEEMPPARRGRAQGILGMACNLGSGLAALLFGFLPYWPGGWRALYALALLPVLGVPLLTRAVPESHRWLVQRGAERPRLRGRDARLLGLSLVVAFFGMAYDTAGFGLASFFVIDRHGWSPAEVSALIVVAGGMGLPGWMIGGRLADRVGRRPVAMLSLIGLTIAEAGFFLGGSRSLWPAFAAMVFFQGGKTAVLRAWATELFPTGVRGATASGHAGAATLGGMVGLAAAGGLAPYVGGLGPALASVSAVGIVAAAVASFLPETARVELEEIRRG